MAGTGFSVGTFTGGGTFAVELLSGTYTPVGVMAWGGVGTVTRVGPTAATALPTNVAGGTLNAGTVTVANTGTVTGTVGISGGTISTIAAGTVAISTIAAGTVAISTIAAGTIVATAAGTQTVAGTVNTGNAGTVAMVQAGTLDMLKAGTISTVGGTVTTSDVAGTAGARTNFTGTAAGGTALAANANRLGAWFDNQSDQAFLLGIGTAAVGTASYSKRLEVGEFLSFDGYTGEVQGMLTAAAASGAVRVTEVTK